MSTDPKAMPGSRAGVSNRTHEMVASGLGESWLPENAKPGDTWGAYYLCPDWWWRLKPPSSPNDQAMSIDPKAIPSSVQRVVIWLRCRLIYWCRRLSCRIKGVDGMAHKYRPGSNEWIAEWWGNADGISDHEARP